MMDASERFRRTPHRRWLRVLSTIVCIIVWALSVAPTSAQPTSSVVSVPSTLKRFALVIGNADYKHVPTLRNPKSDATAMAAKLRLLGYDVHFAENLDRRGMNDAIATFLARIEPGSETLVYYSGHGVELNGSNYLLPVDIPALSTDQDRMLRSEGLNLTELLLDIEGRSARVTLVILDACRDNPFRVVTAAGTKSLGSTRGLGRVDPPRGTFVIFAAGVGEQALDNLGGADTDPNGLFTRKLLKFLDEDGLEIRSMVQKLRAEVRLAALSRSGHNQTPSYYDQLLGEFYFRPPSGRVEEASRNTCDILVDPNMPSSAILGADIQAGVQACLKAVSDFPAQPRFAGLLHAAREQHAFQRAISSSDKSFAQAYLALYDGGRYADVARQYLANLGPERLDVPKPPNPSPAPAETAKVLQAELKRVGCHAGAINGDWGRASEQALRAFNKHAGAKLETKFASLDAIEQIRTHVQPVCPINCGPGQKLSGGRCVASANRKSEKIGRAKPSSQDGTRGGWGAITRVTTPSGDQMENRVRIIRSYNKNGNRHLRFEKVIFKNGVHFKTEYEDNVRPIP